MKIELNDHSIVYDGTNTQDVIENYLVMKVNFDHAIDNGIINADGDGNYWLNVNANYKGYFHWFLGIPDVAGIDVDRAIINLEYYCDCDYEDYCDCQQRLREKYSENIDFVYFREG